MSISRWDPWTDFVSLRDAMDQLLGESFVPGRGSGGRNSLAVDVQDQDDAYVVHAQLPGVRPEDVNVRVTGNVVEVSGQTHQDSEHPSQSGQQDQQGRWLMRERATAAYRRVLTLPTAVQADQADASYQHGVLTLRLPKAQQARARSIPVRAGQGQHQTEGQSQGQSPHGTEVPVTGGAQDDPDERRDERATEVPYTPIPTSGGWEEDRSTRSEPMATGSGGAPEETVGDVAGLTTPPTKNDAGAVRQIGGVGPSASAPIDRGRVREGMEVIGPQGGHIGSVKAVREHDFLIDRSMQRDVYVPYTSVMGVAGTRVTISVGPDQVDNMGWQKPNISI